MKLSLTIITILTSIFFVNTFNFAIELSVLKQTCCCKKDCKCYSEFKKQTLIRNLKCGDKTTSSVTVISKNLILNQPTSLNNPVTFINQRLITDKKPYNPIFNIDPPPPRLFKYFT